LEAAHLEMTGVRHAYGGVTVLDVPRFSVFRGECLAVLGPNGSGKSTLLRLASLQERPTAGTVSYRGEEVGRGNGLALRRRFTLLLQRPFLFAGSVERNVLYGLKVRRTPKDEMRKRLARTADLFGIGPLLGRDARLLSGGEVQRVNLARAFILEPEILFLDEPFSPLDAPSREGLLSELDRVLRETGQTTVFVTHHREEAAFLGDRLAVLAGGRVLQEGPTAEVFAAPADDATARLLGHATLLKGVVEERRGDLVVVAHAGTRILAAGSAAAGEEVVLFVRPEDVLLARGRFASSVRNWFEGRVVDVAPSDRFALVTLDCGFPLKALLTKASVEELGVRPGETFHAGVKAASLRALPSEGDEGNGESR
jgi:tungstate transport system ATP-binding protein